MSIVDDIGRARYVSLTTYRKNGAAVATPVWHAVDGDEVFIVSDSDAWKVKRIRANSHAVVTVCGIRGKVEPGAPSAEGTARLLDQAGTQAARKLIAQKYVLSRIGNWITRLLRRSPTAVIGIAVKL